MNRLPKFFPHVLALAALLIVSLFVWRPGFAQEKDKAAQPTVKWEYKVVRTVEVKDVTSARIEEALNKLGPDGWEYVGTIIDEPNNAPAVCLICKRPKR